MGNRAARVAGPFLRRFDQVSGQRREPASPEVIEEVLRGYFPNVVVDEWVNEARKRHGIPTTSQIAGQKYREGIAKRRQDRLESQDRRLADKQRKDAIGNLRYRPGIYARLQSALEAVARWRARRKSRATKRT